MTPRLNAAPRLQKIMWLFLLLLLCSYAVQAQHQTFRGRVTGGAKKTPLPNISILISDSTRGTITNRNGAFSIIATRGETLTITGVGYIPQQIVLGNKTSLAINLMPDESQMETVVVTALGIKRKEKALGYSVTEIQGEDLTKALSSNWTDALSGKVAGLNLIRSGAGPTASNKIILRGENNLTGNNEALIVVDGVVINNSSGRRSANAGEAINGTKSDNMPADYGSGLNDINPEDIESVSVLKGPGAAALYGQRGANGAIIITTKSGKKKKGWRVHFNSNYAIEKPNRWPDLQFEYGQGVDGALYYSFGSTEDGASTRSTSSAYGPKFDGQYFYQFNPHIVDSLSPAEITKLLVDSIRTLWRPYTNKLRNYFKTGKTATNSITMSAAIDKTNLRFSYTNVHNNWITPNTGYNRNSLALSVNSKLNNKLALSAKVNYTNKSSDNLPGAGYGNQSIMYWFIFWLPNADIDWLKNYWLPGNEGRRILYPYSSYPENPYAIAYEFINEYSRGGVTGNLKATYKITNGLTATLRTNLDYAKQRRAQKRPYDAGSKFPYGSYRTQNITTQEASTDFLLRYKKKISNYFDFSITGGASTLDNNYDRQNIAADSLNAPGQYNFYNKGNKIDSSIDKSKYRLNSLYGLATLGYKNYLFLDISARQDWNSVLATPSRTTNAGFFYPALNMSYVLSDAHQLPKVIHFAKLRFSAASVGSGTTIPYRTSYTYPTAGFFYGGDLQNSKLLANPNLKPLRTVTFELGTNIKLFKSRIGIDVAVYKGNTKNQILERVLDASSGYQREVINAGNVRNTGFELALKLVPVAIKNSFKWTSNIVFSTNKNRIVDMPDSSVVLQLGFGGGGQIVAKVGGSMGDLYGRGYLRAPDGQVVYDPLTGVALIDENVTYLGNTIPKGKFGIENQFSYRRIRLSFLFDGQYGAVSHSLSHYKLADAGKLTKTLPGRYNGIIGNGVLDNGDGTYRKNDVIATDIDEYYRSHFGSANAEGSTFSTDFIKLREVRFDVSLSKKLLKKWNMEKATIWLYGRNLFIWSPWPIFDPEFGTIYGSDIIRGFEVAQFPSTRTMGVNLVLGF